MNAVHNNGDSDRRFLFSLAHKIPPQARVQAFVQLRIPKSSGTPVHSGRFMHNGQEAYIRSTNGATRNSFGATRVSPLTVSCLRAWYQRVAEIQKYASATFCIATSAWVMKKEAIAIHALSQH